MKRGSNVRVVAAVLLIGVLLCSMAGCAMGSVSGVQIDYGYSERYTKKEMDEAIREIKKEFLTWGGCELHTISYSSDEECSRTETLAWINDKGFQDEPFDEYIVFYSSFHSPVDGGDGWNADDEYTNWQWFLARTNKGQWKLVDWGY